MSSGNDEELKGAFGAPNDPTRQTDHHPSGSRSSGQNFLSTTPELPPGPQPAMKDPMKSFRGVMAGTLIMEGITVALALPVINKFAGGIGTVQGWILIGVALVLVLCCGVLKRRFAVPLVLALQAVLMGFFFVSLAVSVIGLLFLALWLWLLWLRRDVSRRMDEGRLPSQQARQPSTS